MRQANETLADRLERREVDARRRTTSRQRREEREITDRGTRFPDGLRQLDERFRGQQRFEGRLGFGPREPAADRAGVRIVRIVRTLPRMLGFRGYGTPRVTCIGRG